MHLESYMLTTWFDTPLFSELEAFRRDVDALLSPSNSLRGVGESLGSGLHLADEGTHYLLSGDLPGLSSEQVTLDVQGRTLKLEARRSLDAPEGFQARHRERRAWSLERSIRVPSDVDLQAIEASMVDGVLSVRLPRAEPQRPRRIPVTSV